MSNEKLNKFEWIDFGRAVAVLLVLMVHTGKLFPMQKVFKNITEMGDMGVQLFFILSAFTLFHSYKSRYFIDDKNKDIFFLIRRFFRISPLYYTCAIFYTLLQIAIKGTESVEYWKVFAAVFYLNGLILPAISYNIPPGAWSIGTEVLFYLFLPTLFRKIAGLRFALYFLFIAIILSNIINLLSYNFINFYTAYDYNHLREYPLYFWILNQLPVFCFGIVLFHPFQKYNFENQIVKNSFIFLAILLFVGCSQLPFSLNYPAYFFQREYVFSMVFCVFLVGIKDRKFDSCVYRFIKRIGRYSFGMYLSHFFVLTVFNYVFLHYYSFQKNEVSFVFSFLGVVGVTYLISSSLHRFEKWGISLGNALINRLKYTL